MTIPFKGCQYLQPFRSNTWDDWSFHCEVKECSGICSKTSDRHKINKTCFTDSYPVVIRQEVKKNEDSNPPSESAGY
jgi:hypothetical protein